MVMGSLRDDPPDSHYTRFCSCYISQALALMSRPTLAVSRLPMGWNGRFLTAPRQNDHDVPKWPRFRPVGLSAMLAGGLRATA